MKHLNLISIGVLLLSPVLAIAANRDVCSSCTYHTINDAISGAQSGDTIRIAVGSYLEDVTLNGPKSLRLEGGYSADFSARNVDTYPTIISSANVNYFNVGDEVFDGLTITGSQTQGIFAWSPNSTLTVTNCRIHDNPSSGIYVHGIKSFTIIGNTFSSNSDPTGNYSTAAIFVLDSLHTGSEISDNTITGSTCRYCSGIYFMPAGDNDMLVRNTVYGNTAGININATTGMGAPLIESNVVHSNVQYGFSLQGGAPIVLHNLSYDNGGVGFDFIYPGGATILNNIAAQNASSGFSLSGWLQGTTQPIFRNNISYANSRGLNISGTGGWGATNIYPVSEYNDFFANQMSEMVHSVEYPWGFEEEIPGAYGDFNSLSWSKHNMKHDPGFVDPEHGNFSLRSDSFLIDAGGPDDSYSHEPAPNGGRINIGLNGDTAQAEHSSAAPQINNLFAWISANNVLISFNTGTSTVSNWLGLEYNTGSSFTAVTPSAITGDQIIQGYMGARITTGSERLIIWQGGVSSLPVDPSKRSVRLTLERGNVTTSVTAEICSDCVSILEETPTATTTVEPTETTLPTATVTSVATTPVNTPLPTSTPTVHSTATTSATATSTTIATSTATATATHTKTPQPTETSTPAATHTEIAQPTQTGIPPETATPVSTPIIEPTDAPQPTEPPTPPAAVAPTISPAPSSAPVAAPPLPTPLVNKPGPAITPINTPKPTPKATVKPHKTPTSTPTRTAIPKQPKPKKTQQPSNRENRR